MAETKLRFLRILAVATALCLVAGCESTSTLTKKIDYKSAGSAPALELPPDLTAPQYDDRFSVTTASQLAAQGTKPKGAETIAPDANADARIARAGTQRWLVVKTTPEIAWNTTRQFWPTMGFVLSVEQPTLGIMETDWAENRADTPNTWLQNTFGKYIDIFGSTYRRDKFRTRIERGSEPGTVDIYISHRGSEQVPTAMADRNSPAGWTWAGDAARPRSRGRNADSIDDPLRARPKRRRALRCRHRRLRRHPSARASRKARTGRASSSSTTASTAHGAAWVSRSTGLVSPSSIATARKARISSVIRIPSPTARRRTRAF
jgi:hypothetical protein